MSTEREASLGGEATRSWRWTVYGEMEIVSPEVSSQSPSAARIRLMGVLETRDGGNQPLLSRTGYCEVFSV